MRTAVLTLLLAVSLLVTGHAKTPFDSIRPLQRQVEHAGQTRLIGICSAWAGLYHDQAAWITAAHCVADEEGKLVRDGLYVDKQPVVLKLVNFDQDIAVLFGGPRGVQPLRPAQAVPETLRAVWLAGYPGSSTAIHVVQGIVGNPRDEDGLTFFNVPVAQGMSGAPYIDAKSGLVVGQVIMSECPMSGWCPVSKGVPAPTLWSTLEAGEMPKGVDLRGLPPSPNARPH